MNKPQDRVGAAIFCAAEIVVDKGFMGNYQTSALVQKNDPGVNALGTVMSQIGAVLGEPELMSAQLEIRRNMQAAQKLLETNPAQWAESFQSIKRKPKALQLFERALNIARSELACAPAELRDTRPDKPDFGPEREAAYRRARDHLNSNPQSPRWLALLLFTLARAIGGNARASFSANEWHDGSFFWFDVERAWLAGNGNLVANLLLDADKKFFAKNIASNLGLDMPRRLAEAASFAPDWSLFKPPW